ncbi:MAG: Pyrroline-5-carboxylate reductase [Clostridia bacterium 62_21]|nr:MAG: Pyrroline-5-carboxylate reductase [Clostridia bacterium 62_21]HAG06951.1 pyrroline-5-carboxylate reductase [Peptococcaceae bacterium]
MPAKAIGIIGAGAMGEALATGIVRAGLVRPADLYMTDVRRERLDYLQTRLGITPLTDNKQLASISRVVILAVKPPVVGPVLGEVASALTPEHTVISIAAGVTLAFIEQRLAPGVPVVRVMPNTPCLVGAGASAFALGRYAQAEDAARAREVLEAVGIAVEVPEEHLDIVTGLSGSGPAYAYLVIEALSDGAVRLGLPRQVAVRLAAQTLYGAAKMVLSSEEHPARLRDAVTTPGGTTAAGLFALEEAGVRAAFARAVERATRRATELSK